MNNDNFSVIRVKGIDEAVVSYIYNFIVNQTPICPLNPLFTHSFPQCPNIAGQVVISIMLVHQVVMLNFQRLNIRSTKCERLQV